ncbi:MAG: membrane protein [Gammaproteobacteria bacterium]|nr:MAG: membrane protein [Gammaproteobacteria bacterium]
MALRKTCTFAVLHVTVAFLVVWALSGSPWVGGAAALVEPLCNTVVYFLHEKLWMRRRAAAA